MCKEYNPYYKIKEFAKAMVNAAIKGRKVINNVPKGEKPMKVMYGWEPYTTANLINGAGLPASTFRVKVE